MKVKEPEFYTIEQVSELLGVSQQKFLRWVDRGAIEGIRKLGKYYTVSKDFKVKASALPRLGLSKELVSRVVFTESKRAS